MASYFVESDVTNMQMHIGTDKDKGNENHQPPPGFMLSSPQHGSQRRPMEHINSQQADPSEDSSILGTKSQRGQKQVDETKPPDGIDSSKCIGNVMTPTRTRRRIPAFELPGTNLTQPKTPDNNLIEKKLREIMKLSGILHINGIRYESEMSDLKELGELGFGTSGHVFKMLHVPSQEVIAVKQMRRSGNPEENKRIAMDLDVVLKSHDCPYIVQCLGCFITDSEVWICMELMATCFDKLLKRLSTSIPEPVIGKVSLATVRALHYLKENHDVIHRDVKPSNILLDNRGNVKLCDFGISGHLVNSKANTKNAGCTAYLAPERINPPDPRKPDYDIRADVWSLGITLVELATGSFPYPGCNSDFEVLSRVLQDDPPTVPESGNFSQEFRDFTQACLSKDYKVRPKYKKLLETAFLRKYMEENVDVASWYARVMPSTPSPIHRTNENAAPSTGHQRSFSDASQAHLKFPHRSSGPSPVSSRVMNGSDKGPYDAGGGSTSPLLLQRFLHQQQQHMRRSASVSPHRGLKGEEGSGRKKLGSYLRQRLGCGDSPEPPPRSNRASPLLVRRALLDQEPSSPILNRRHVSPSPPQPPPRRLSESNSVPGSPHHHRLAVFTPQPLRRLWPPHHS